jgi:hypothetical protein
MAGLKEGGVFFQARRGYGREKLRLSGDLVVDKVREGILDP